MYNFRFPLTVDKILYVELGWRDITFNKVVNFITRSFFNFGKQLGWPAELYGQHVYG
jgi:hypothetical protein